MAFTVTELKNILADLESDGLGKKMVKFAHQPDYPIEGYVGHVYANQREEDDEDYAIDGVYLCEDMHEVNGYASKKLFEDDENFIV